MLTSVDLERAELLDSLFVGYAGACFPHSTVGWMELGLFGKR
jgi:hypothetical protein